MTRQQLEDEIMVLNREKADITEQLNTVHILLSFSQSIFAAPVLARCSMGVCLSVICLSVCLSVHSHLCQP